MTVSYYTCTLLTLSHPGRQARCMIHLPRTWRPHAIGAGYDRSRSPFSWLWMNGFDLQKLDAPQPLHKTLSTAPCLLCHLPSSSSVFALYVCVIQIFLRSWLLNIIDLQAQNGLRSHNTFNSYSELVRDFSTMPMYSSETMDCTTRELADADLE